VDQRRQERGEIDSALVSRLRGQPGPAATIRFGIQPGQLPSPVGITPKRKTLVADNAKGEAGQDRRQDRDPRAVCDVSNGRGGYSATTVQDHPSPDRTTQAIGTSADVMGTTVSMVRIAQSLGERSVLNQGNQGTIELRVQNPHPGTFHRAPTRANDGLEMLIASTILLQSHWLRSPTGPYG